MGRVWDVCGKKVGLFLVCLFVVCVCVCVCVYDEKTKSILATMGSRFRDTFWPLFGGLLLVGHLWLYPLEINGPWMGVLIAAGLLRTHITVAVAVREVVSRGVAPRQELISSRGGSLVLLEVEAAGHRCQQLLLVLLQRELVW